MSDGSDVDEARAFLTRAGWSFEEADKGAGWRVSGRHGDTRIDAEGPTRAEAWSNALARARAEAAPENTALARLREKAARIAVPPELPGGLVFFLLATFLFVFVGLLISDTSWMPALVVGGIFLVLILVTLVGRWRGKRQ